MFAIHTLRQYRQGGLAGLLTHKRRSGRKPSIPTWAQEALNSRLQEPEGFNSQDLRSWRKRKPRSS